MLTEQKEKQRSGLSYVNPENELHGVVIFV